MTDKKPKPTAKASKYPAPRPQQELKEARQRIKALEARP